MTFAEWVPCTPDWVKQRGDYGCEVTVRRPILEVCEINSDHYHTIGHEHLMSDDGEVVIDLGR